MAAVLIFFAASAVLLLLLVEVVFRGRQINGQKAGTCKNAWLAKEKTILLHRRWGYALAGFVLLLAFAAPFLLEPLLRNRLTARIDPKIMGIHLALVGVLLVLVALQLRFTGRDKPLLHRRIGWMALVIGIGVVVTGLTIAVKTLL